MTSLKFSNLSSDYLESLRSKTDPLADQVIAEIIASGEKSKVNEVMMRLFQNDSFHTGLFDSLGEEISSLLDRYITSSGQLPPWFDEEKVKTGEKLFSLYGPEIFMLLNVSSLPLCYTCAKGAQVLYETGRLLSHNKEIDPLVRRLMETAQMVVNVLSEGGLSRKGRGVVTLQKVRLIHASIRHYLKAGQYHNTPWDASHFGEPINQEDLTGTLMSFGPVILNGLNKLNISLTSEEIDSYMHCWKVVGYLMGIEEELLPDTYQEGTDLAVAILAHQAAPSDAGVALTNSCIQFINYLLPGNAFDKVPAYFMHYFLDDFSSLSKVDLAACIGIADRTTSKDTIVLRLSKLIVGALSQLEDHQLIAKLSTSINTKMLEGIIHHFNQGKNVQFFIPPSLQKDWGLSKTQ